MLASGTLTNLPRRPTIKYHIQLQTTNTNATICQFQNNHIMGTSDGDRNIGQFRHSIARSQHQRVFSSSVCSKGFHVSSMSAVTSTNSISAEPHQTSLVGVRIEANHSQEPFPESAAPMLAPGMRLFLRQPRLCQNRLSPIMPSGGMLLYAQHRNAKARARP